MKCENCGKEFEPNNYHPNQKFCCRKCYKKCYDKSHSKKYYREYKEECRERKKRWRQKNPEYSKKYYQKNKEYYREHGKKWRQKHKEEKNEYVRKWGQEHPEKRKAIVHKRRARIKGNGGSFTAKQIKELRKKSLGICIGYKRKPHFVGEDKLEIEHIIPIAKGGSSNISNIQLLCGNCNRRKGIN